MNTFLVQTSDFSGGARRRFARRFVLLTSAPSCRRFASCLPRWDGTDPALRGLMPAEGGHR